MALALTGTADQALLASVIAEARKAADQADTFVGRTAVQKMMYFLKVMGVPMSYRFSIHHFGPFCEEILRDVDWLIADDVITDRSTEPRYSNYAPSGELDALVSKHAHALTAVRNKITGVAQLAKCRPEKLELWATLDYLYRQARATGTNGPWKERVVSELKEIKGGKFSDEEIGQVYDTMLKLGIVAS
jgi:uncharacterized protein